MLRVTINENQRGLLFKNGRFAEILLPGSYFYLGSAEVEVLPVYGAIEPQHCTLETLTGSENVSKNIHTLNVPDGCVALHYLNGVFAEILKSGNYAYFKVGSHRFKLIDISEPRITGEALKVIDKIPQEFYNEFIIRESQRGRLTYDGRFKELLKPGRYFFWRGSVDVNCDNIDVNFNQYTVAGQELLTSDKITLRISFVFNCRIVDPERIVEVGNYIDQLYTAAQLALRDYVGLHTLDEILAGKQEMSDYVTKKLVEKAPGLFVEVRDAGVRDIILPGEIRDIMNTVLVAEKRAQANVITRREEVASTRSLLNTAKLMDENKTLYRLKELEYLGKICEQVGSITLSGQGDVLAQLAALTGAKNEK